MKSLPRPVESQQVSIDTATVTIRALHIDKKQMTLAVFRQLPEMKEPENASLWGIVNYPQDGLFLLFVFEERVFKRRIDTAARSYSSFALCEAEKRLEQCKRLAVPRYYDEPGYWEEQLKIYSAQRVQEEKNRRTAEASKEKAALAAAEKAVEEERKYLQADRQRESARVTRELHLIKTLPQLFIAI